MYCVLWDWFETDRQQTNASIHYICGENSPVAPKEVQFRWPKRLLNSPRNFSTRVSVVSLLRDALRWDVDYTSTWLPFFATCKKSAVIVFYRCKDMNPRNLWTLSLYVQYAFDVAYIYRLCACDKSLPNDCYRQKRDWPRCVVISPCSSCNWVRGVCPPSPP